MLGMSLGPIIMTSLAFILGVLPLVIAHGAGAEMRRTLGTAVFAGMIGVTLFGIFLTPVFFYVVCRLSGPRRAPGTINSVLGCTVMRLPVRPRMR
jgi:multidrug efflux pump